MTCSKQENDRRERRRRLAAALGIGSWQSYDWTPDDLAAIFHYQMEAPVVFDLSSLDPTIGARLALLAQTKGLLLRSFRDLLLHPSPPVELLRLAKEFAKANCDHPESVLPDPVAKVLYYASIASALVRCATNISKFGDKELARRFRWSAEQAWVEAPLKELLREALRLVETPA